MSIDLDLNGWPPRSRPQVQSRQGWKKCAQIVERVGLGGIKTQVCLFRRRHQKSHDYLCCPQGQDRESVVAANVSTRFRSSFCVSSLPPAPLVPLNFQGRRQLHCTMVNWGKKTFIHSFIHCKISFCNHVHYIPITDACVVKALLQVHLDKFLSLGVIFVCPHFMCE